MFLTAINDDIEIRNYLIDISNNFNNYSLRDLISKIDERYYKIIQLINNDINLTQEFNYCYDVIDTIVSDISYNDNIVYDIYIIVNMINVIRKIIDTF